MIRRATFGGMGWTPGLGFAPIAADTGGSNVTLSFPWFTGAEIPPEVRAMQPAPPAAGPLASPAVASPPGALCFAASFPFVGRRVAVPDGYTCSPQASGGVGWAISAGIVLFPLLMIVGARRRR